MPHNLLVIKVDPIKQTYTRMVISGGRSFTAPIQRVIRAKQLGWMELCKIEENRLMGTRQKSHGPGTETYDAGPTPLIVAADNQADEGTPGFRLRGGKTTAGIAILFGQGVGGGIIGVPVDTDWLKRQLVWVSADEMGAEGDEGACINHPDRPVRETLDGDALC